MDNRVCSMSSLIEPPFVQGKPGEIRGRKATGQASASWQVSRAAEGRLSALSVADREGVLIRRGEFTWCVGSLR